MYQCVWKCGGIHFSSSILNGDKWEILNVNAKNCIPQGWSGMSKRFTKYELKLSYYYVSKYLKFSHALGSIFLSEIFPLRCTRCKRTVVTGPLVPPQILSHHSERKVKVHYMYERQDNIRNKIFVPRGKVTSIWSQCLEYAISCVASKRAAYFTFSCWHATTCGIQREVGNIWLSPVTKAHIPREIKKIKRQHKDAIKNFDYRMIADRLRMVNFCNNCHSGGVIKLDFRIPTLHLTAEAV